MTVLQLHGLSNLSLSSSLASEQKKKKNQTVINTSIAISKPRNISCKSAVKVQPSDFSVFHENQAQEKLKYLMQTWTIVL